MSNCKKCDQMLAKIIEVEERIRTDFPHLGAYKTNPARRAEGHDSLVLLVSMIRECMEEIVAQEEDHEESH